MYFEYETNRLILKKLDESFAGKVLKFYVEGDKYFGSAEPERPQYFYTKEYMQKLLKYEGDAFLAGSMARYYIFEKNDYNKIIGTISLRDIKRNSFCSGQIGYKLLQNYTMRGYGTEAVRAVVNIAFDNGLHRVNAYVQPDNQSSIRVLEKSGFIREGVLHKYAKLRGVWKDHCLYACINDND